MQFAPSRVGNFAYARPQCAFQVWNSVGGHCGINMAEARGLCWPEVKPIGRICMMAEATNQEKEWDSKSSKRSHDRRVLLQLREDLASYEWPFVDADLPVA